MEGVRGGGSCVRVLVSRLFLGACVSCVVVVTRGDGMGGGLYLIYIYFLINYIN